MHTVVVRLLGVLTLSVSLVAAALAAERVGEVEKLRGEVRATLDSTERVLREKDLVYAGERLATGRDGLLMVRLDDGSQFALSRDAEFVVERFAYKGDPDTDTVAARVVKGAFRFVSGLIARKKSSQMKVGVGAVATIGVRGTHVGGEVEGDRAVVVLLEPEHEGPNAITVSNDFGSVDIDEPGFGTEIPDANSPPSPPQRMRLRTLDNLMRNIQSISRASMPRPIH